LTLPTWDEQLIEWNDDRAYFRGHDLRVARYGIARGDESRTGVLSAAGPSERSFLEGRPCLASLLRWRTRSHILLWTTRAGELALDDKLRLRGPFSIVGHTDARGGLDALKRLGVELAPAIGALDGWLEEALLVEGDRVEVRGGTLELRQETVSYRESAAVEVLRSTLGQLVELTKQ
jgi:hypothetical protein